MKLLSDGQLHVEAVIFLQKRDRSVADLLARCELKYEVDDLAGRIDTEKPGLVTYPIAITLHCPGAAYEVLADEAHQARHLIRNAIKAVVPEGFYLKYLFVEELSADADLNNHDKLIEIPKRRDAHNQAVRATEVFGWETLRFRSITEIRIAEALDRAGVLFFPNCKVRLGPVGARKNIEPDFLICHDGKWGILEVDGELTHPPSRTAQDHERDRALKMHGMRVIEHFDASKCFEDPDGVVQEFLEILRRV